MLKIFSVTVQYTRLVCSIYNYWAGSADLDVSIIHEKLNRNREILTCEEGTEAVQSLIGVWLKHFSLIWNCVGGDNSVIWVNLAEISNSSNVSHSQWRQLISQNTTIHMRRRLQQNEKKYSCLNLFCDPNVKLYCEQDSLIVTKSVEWG